MAYHRDRGEQHRRICLIPASAHGTNAASSQMAGLGVVTLPTDKDGGVSLEVFKEQVLEGLCNLPQHRVRPCSPKHEGFVGAVCSAFRQRANGA